MPVPQGLMRGLRLPAIAAPMFLVSGVDLVIAARRSGMIGSFPVTNARTIDVLDDWMRQIVGSSTDDSPEWALNLIVHSSYTRFDEELELVKKYQPKLVITALGSPARVIETVHSYGGYVLADVNSIGQAKKSAELGVDGLVLVCSGAGGHTGNLSPFAFVPAVREFFDGIIVAGGAIGTGQGVHAMQVLGADFGYIGTHLIPAEESLAQPAYKDMVVNAGPNDIIQSAALTGAKANWLKPSLIAAGYDPDELATQKTDMKLGAPEDNSAKRWKDVWSAGQGVGSIRQIAPASEIITQLVKEYQLSTGRRA